MPSSTKNGTRPSRLLIALLPALALASAGAAGWSGAPGSSAAAASSSAPAAAPQATSPKQANVVFVLTDDLSSNLLRYMPHVRGLQRTGTSFRNYTVTDSLCCPSRASTFTGRYPHNTGVFTNTGDDGGFRVFHDRGLEKQTFAVDLQKAGYRTAMMGKYLNGYQPTATVDGQPNYVPPGWDDWAVAGNGYGEFGYALNHNGAIEQHGRAAKDYLTDVISAKGSAFVRRSAAEDKPFFLELASFAPHAPYTPAPRDARTFPGLRAPRGPAFDRLPTHAPSWLRSRDRLTTKQKASIDRAFRRRVQSVQAVDRMVGSLQATLSRAGVAQDTVVVFSSDNGYHMGQYRLMPGKQTAFDTDVNVPLVASGAGVRRNAVVQQPAQNIDLAPTFAALAGATPGASRDGRSLVSLLRSGRSTDPRGTSLVEHRGPDRDPADPDFPQRHSGNPPTYEALRTARYTYVEYANGQREYYDRSKDPHQLHNVASRLSTARRAALHRRVVALSSCRGTTCSRAGR